MQHTTLTRTTVARAARHLARKDPDLAAILERHGPPPLWDRAPGFSTLLHIILEQQVSLASARAIFDRVASSISPLTPEAVAAAGEEHLRRLGLTRQKAAYCVHAARAITMGGFSLATLSRLNDEQALARLQSLKGIGPWSAEVYLLMAMLRADIWPAGDLALAVAMMNVKRLRRRPHPQKLREMAESWRPYRSVAARMLWQSYLNGEKK